MGKSGHLSLFHFFEALNDALFVIFQAGLHFYTLLKTLIVPHVGPCSSVFLWKHCETMHLSLKW